MTNKLMDEERNIFSTIPKNNDFNRRKLLFSNSHSGLDTMSRSHIDEITDKCHRKSCSTKKNHYKVKYKQINYFKYI